MAILKDSSEIREAADIFGELVDGSAVVAGKKPSAKPVGARGAFVAQGRRTATPKTKPRTPGVRPPEAPRTDSKFRGDKLENVLFAMCRRGGFSGAVIVDSDGLPLAVYNSPVAEELAAAFTMILGEALEKGANLLNQADASNISVDINYLEKAVVRKFPISEATYYLMTICPQDMDERSEIELSIEQVVSILKKK